MRGLLIRKVGFLAIFFAGLCLYVSNDVRAEMDDDPVLTTIILDQLEVRDLGGDNGLFWDVQGWLGKDLRKLWFKTDGERNTRGGNETELQLLYSKAIARYWDIQFGVRYDFDSATNRSWAAIGVKGLAPYFFDIDAVAFIGESGRAAVRFEIEYEMRLTQRLILTPDIEINLHAQDDREVGVGSGLSDLDAGLRLRYEIRHEFAPYIGISWTKLFGETADFARTAGEDVSAAQLMIGIRARF